MLSGLLAGIALQKYPRLLDSADDAGADDRGAGPAGARKSRPTNPLSIFGRVPLFFFVVTFTQFMAWSFYYSD
jgi:hypothetical protein